MTAPRVGVVGLWHLGTVTASGLAATGVPTVGLERDPSVAAELSQARPPLFEPGLAESVANGIARGVLRFDSDPEALRDTEFVWLAADTALDGHYSPDIGGLRGLVRWIAPHVPPAAILIVSSQAPVGTCELLRDELLAESPDWCGRVASVPENLRLGSALARFRHPDWLVIGADDDATAAAVTELLAPIEGPRIVTGLRTAELAKHAINAYLATCIGLANELGDLAEAVGADGLSIARILRSDRRVSREAPVRPGVGFSGGTLSRDLASLREVGHRHQVRTPIADAVAASNQARRHKVLAELRTRLDLSGAVVAVLGVAYRPNTDTTRDSDSLRLIDQLVGAGSQVRVHDPLVSELRLPPGAGEVATVADAVSGADALVVMTEHDQFRQLNLSGLLPAMTTRLVVDPHHLLAGQVDALQLDYVAFGRATSGSRSVAR